MDDAVTVSLLDGQGDVVYPPDGLCNRRKSAAPDDLRQRRAVDVGHGQVQNVTDLAHVEDRAKVGMGQPGRRTGLAQESLPKGGAPSHPGRGA